MEQEKKERRKPVARNSRAAQEAQRRREARKENARLSTLREKQKKKAKKRTHRRISPRTWKRLAIMAGIVVAVVLSMIIFFRVHTVTVEGNGYYTADEIIAAAGVTEGDNLLTVSRAEVAGNVMAKLHYIRSVAVTRRLPDGIVISVTEYDATYGVTDTEGAYYLMTAGGKITEAVEREEIRQTLLVQGLVIEPPAIGQIAVAHEDEALTAEGKLAAACALLQELEDSELIKQVTAIDVSSAYDLGITYDNQYDVRLGNSDQLDYKLEFLRSVVAELAEDHRSGTIDLSMSQGSQALFRPDEG